MRWLAIVPIAVSASAAGATFRPVEDRPYRYETVELRSADGVTRRFRASRTVVFHRTDDGYAVTVTLEGIDPPPGDAGRMFATATGALLRHPLRYRLDATGAIRDMEDSDGAIALIADAIERMTALNTKRSDHSRALASPLRALSAERKAAMLHSILLPVLAGGAADRPAGQRAITVPRRPPSPSDTTLAGLETVSRGATGIVTITVRAQGVVAAAPAGDMPGSSNGGPGASPEATLHTVRNIDPTTGLVLDSRETREATIADAEGRHTSLIETTVTLTLAAK